MIRRIVLSGSMILIFLAGVAMAVPGQINFQGFLKDSSGTSLTGSYPITFTIYDSATAGNDLWHETQTVAVGSGLYSVQLGSTAAIASSVFNGDTRYLGIKVGTDAEMAPRIPMITVPYAFRAATADLARSVILPDNISVTGVITAGAFVGDGSQLTGISATTAESVANADSVDGIHASSEAKANYLYPLDSNKTFALSGSYEFGSIIRGENSAGSGLGIIGHTTGTGAQAILGQADGANSIGVWGLTTNPAGGTGGSFQGSGDSGIGVNAQGKSDGVYAIATGDPGAIGVRGHGGAWGATGTNYGGYFSARGTTAIGVCATAEGAQGKGVYGIASDATPGLYQENYGGYFVANGGYGRGVYGHSTSTDPGGYGGFFVSDVGQGVLGMTFGTGVTSAGSIAVQGYAGNNDANAQNIGGFFQAAGGRGIGLLGRGFGNNSPGVYGQALGDSGIGVSGEALSTATAMNYGGHFSAAGSVGVGVKGISAGAGGGGVYGSASDPSGVNYGVIGTTASPNGYAGFFNGGKGIKLASGYLIMSYAFTPSSSADGAGEQGEIRWDDSYIYVKTSGGWKRSALSSW
jgi:hypothetical protein